MESGGKSEVFCLTFNKITQIGDWSVTFCILPSSHRKTGTMRKQVLILAALAILSVAAGLSFTNNKGTVFNSQLPDGVTTFWDSTNSKITPENENDFMTSSFMFKAKNDNIDGYFTLFIDIPTLGERFTSVHRFPKGANVEHGFDMDICHFISNQFYKNGRLVKITDGLGDLESYDKQFRFNRTHKAK